MPDERDADPLANATRLLKFLGWKKRCEDYGSKQGCGSEIVGLRVGKQDERDPKLRKWMFFDPDTWTPHYKRCPNAKPYEPRRQSAPQSSGPADFAPPSTDDDDLPF